MIDLVLTAIVILFVLLMATAALVLILIGADAICQVLTGDELSDFIVDILGKKRNEQKKNPPENPEDRKG